MPSASSKQAIAAALSCNPAEPLWRLAPTHDDDGRSLADFMMLIPRLNERPAPVRERIAVRVREICAGYGRQVAFADINLSLNVLWISVVAEPGLAGRVAQSIRADVPDALLVGGQLGAAMTAVGKGPNRSLWRRTRRRIARMLDHLPVTALR